MNMYVNFFKKYQTQTFPIKKATSWVLQELDHESGGMNFGFIFAINLWFNFEKDA